MSERKYKHPQVNLRLPEELKEKIAEMASINGRSANAEMVAALEAWVLMDNSTSTPAKTIADLSRKIETLSKRIEQLEKSPPATLK